MTIPSRILKAELPALVWAHPEATASSPMLIAHDGPEYAEHSSLLALLAGLPPLRAALIGPSTATRRTPPRRRLRRRARPGAPAGAPGRRHGPRSAWARASARSRCFTPTSAIRTRSTRCSCSRAASSGSARQAYESELPALRAHHPLRRRRPAQPAPSETIPVALTCGTAEENLARNRALAESLVAQGYDVRLHEFRDAHNWVCWRDAFDPHLPACSRQ